MAVKYYVFHYSETTSKQTGSIYCNIDFIPDTPTERVLSVSISKDYLKRLDPSCISGDEMKKHWYEIYSFWNNEWKQRVINGLRVVGNKM